MISIEKLFQPNVLSNFQVMHSHKFRSYDLLWSFDCIYFQCAVVVFPHQNLDAITSTIFINITHSTK